VEGRGVVRIAGVIHQRDVPGLSYEPRFFA
jgi:hypothetical protein